MYRVGQRVDGLYDENTDDMWYPGRIRSVHRADPKTDNADVTFEVLYDDGEVETNVRLEFLRQHVSGTICAGTRVLCRYDGGDEFYPGQVSDVQENGRYTIAYDDGEVEEDVPVDYIMEPEEEENVEAEDPAEEPREIIEDVAHNEPQQQEAEMVNVKDTRNSVVDEGNCVDSPQDNEANVNEESKSDDEENNEPVENVRPPRVEHSFYNEAPQAYRQKEDLPTTMSPEMPAERTYVIESLQLLEKRLGDAASTKSVLSTLVKQMRAYPQVTADLVHERGGERLIIDALKFHQSHAVIQCYGCVLLRRLCFLCVNSTNFLLRNGIVELVIQAMNAFAEDAILQASACGALAVFTRVHAGLNSLIEFQVAQLVLSTLIYHKTYSVHTRQVHYYACEVLLELCELDDLQTLNLLCGEQEEDFTGDMSPISLLLFLLRQGLSLDDKKACCAVGSLLMCLTASGRRAATLILGLNGLAELSTVMARYPTEPSIQKYSSAASKQIALCSVRQSPTKRIKDTATVILREAESIEHTPADNPVSRRGAPRRSTGTGKRKSNPSSGYGASAYSRGAAYSSSTHYRNSPVFSKASPYEQFDSGFGGEMNSFGYPARNFHPAATAPQQPSSLVILDGNLGADSGFKRKPPSKEDRQSELFDAYGIQGFPNSTNGRPYGTKRAQLKAHLASAESTWATPQHIPSSHSSRSEHFDPGSAYSHRDFMPSRQNRYNESHNSSYDPELRQPRGAKRKKKNSGVRTAFQVRVENENQLRVSRETHLQYPSPQRLGAATKRAAKARQKRITAAGHSSLTGRLNDASSESLNDYATQLFQENASRAGSGSSRLTPREKEEIRERERLSFAEKLHKMIDKAKSTLANGNLTSVPTVDTVSRPKKAGTGTKTARRARELSTTPSEEKRPQSKKTRTVNSSTPKHVTKEILSPRDTAETRPAKPTSTGATKRAAAISDPPSVAVPRAKPTVSRTVVTSKTTTYQKPRASIKSSKAAPIVPIDRHEAERKKESAVDVALVDVTPVCSEDDNPSQGEAHVAAVESVEIAAPPVEPKPVEQVEPVVSSGEDVVNVNEPSDVVTELQDGVDPTSGDDGNTGDIAGTDAVVERVTVMATPAEDHASVDMPLAATVKTAPEQAEPSTDAQQQPTAASETTDDQPSGGKATVDGMYDDAYGEFDDNGGDDEEMTEAGADIGGTQIPATEPSNPPADIPLQQSKSGEALYDDGYDEFDEDEAPNDVETEEAEAEDAPATEPVDNQGRETSDNISSEPPEIESDSAAKLSEVVSEQLAGEEIPTVAGEEEVSAPTEEGDVGDESSPNDNDDGKRGDVIVDESKHETAQELQPNTTDIGNDDPIVGNAEEVQDSNNSSDPVAEPCTADDAAHAEQVDVAVNVNADIGSCSSTTDKYEAEPDASASIPTSVIESAETEQVIGGTVPSTDPAALDGEPDSPGDVASVDPAPQEVPVISAQPEHADIKSTEETEASVPPDTAYDSLSTPDQDGEAKKMSADDSTGSIQSPAYDEENFDDEENHQEAELNEPVEVSSATVAVEEQQQELCANTDDASAQSERSTDAVCTPDREEEESKTLAANSSDLSVQSNAYEDEDFDAGAQDEAHVDLKTPEQEPSRIEVAEHDAMNTLSEPIAPDDNVHIPPKNDEDNKPKETTVDNEDALETYGDEDFDSTAQDEMPKGTRADLVPESTDDRSEPQGLEDNDFASTPESEAVTEPPVAIAGSEVPDTMVLEETKNDQVPVINESNKCDEAQADEAITDNNASADKEDHVKSSDPVPVSAESSTNDVSDEIDKPQSEAPDIAIPTEEKIFENPGINSGEQPATYDDDEFDNGTEEKEVTPISAVTEDSGLGVEEGKDEDSKSEELEDEPTEPPSDKAGDSAVARAANIDDPVVVEAISPEAQPQVNNQPEQLDESPTEDEPDSSTVLDKTGDSVSEVAPEHTAATVITSEDEGDQAELPVESETSISNVVDNPVSPPESEILAATSEHDPSQENSTTPEDKAEVSSEPEIAGDTVPAEILPEAETPSAEPDGVPTDEPDESVAIAEATESIPEYAQDDDAFDEETPEANPVAMVADEISADTSVDAAHEEDQYGDTEFDDAENDVAALTDVESENKPTQGDSSANEEIKPPDSANTKDSLPSQISEAAKTSEESEAGMRDDGEEPTNDTKNEAADLPDKTHEAEVEVSEAGANTDGDVDVDTCDAAADIDDSSAGVNQDTNELIDVEASKPLISNPDATAYEDDFPVDFSPETQEDVAVDPGATSTEDDAVDNDENPVDNEAPAIDSSTSNETCAPGRNVDVSAQLIDPVPDSTSKDESYDDGFDDDATAPAIDTNNSSDAVDTSSSPEANDAVNMDAEALSTSTVADISEDNVVMEREQPQEAQNGTDEIDTMIDTIPVEGVAHDEIDPHTEDQNGNDELDTTAADSAVQDDIDVKAAECDVVDAVEVEPTETPEKTEPVESELEGVMPDAVEPVPVEPECVEHASVDSETVEPEDVKVEAAIVERVRSEPVESKVVEPEPDASQVKAVDSDIVQSEVTIPEAEAENVGAVGPDNKESQTANPPTEVPTTVEPQATEPEANAEETGAVVPGNKESEPADPSTEEPTIVEPQAAESETIVPDFVSPEVTDPDVIETEATTASHVPKSPMESSIDGTTPAESAVPETNEEGLPTEPLEASILADLVASNSGDLHVAEVPVEVPAETPTETIDQKLADYGSTGETNGGGLEGEVASSKDGVIDPPTSEKPVDDTSLSVGEAQSEHPADATADEPQEPAQSEAEGTLEIDPPRPDTTSPVEKSVSRANSAPVSLDEQEATGEPQSTDEGTKEDTVLVRNEPVESSSVDGTTPEPAAPIEAPTEEAQPIVENHPSVEPDYADDYTPEDESPVVAENESKCADDVEVQEEKPSNRDIIEGPPEEPVVQEKAETPDASENYVELSDAAEELAIEVKPPQSEVAVEAASEGPKTEDQYDDDEAYNEFEEQDNEIATPASPPVVEAPIPAATEAATEDDYEEYENDDYGEEENTVETPRAEPVEVPSSTRSEPPASAREEEIEEVADATEAEEEAYVDNADDYNNEYEDDDVPAVTSAPQSSLPKSTPVEASTDEYEDDNEEDYAEDEVEDSPPKPAPTPTPTVANKSDDEMEEEVGYESDECAESDG